MQIRRALSALASLPILFSVFAVSMPVAAQNPNFGRVDQEPAKAAAPGTQTPEIAPKIAGDENWANHTSDGLNFLPVGRVRFTAQKPTTSGASVGDDEYIAYRFRLRALGGKVLSSNDPGAFSGLLAPFYDKHEKLYVALRLRSAYDNLRFKGDVVQSAVPFFAIVNGERTSRRAYQTQTFEQNGVLLGPRPLGQDGDVRIDVAMRWGKDITTTVPALVLKAAGHLATGGLSLPVAVSSALISMNDDERASANAFFEQGLSRQLGTTDSDGLAKAPVALSPLFFKTGSRLVVSIYDRDAADPEALQLVSFALEPEAPRKSVLAGVMQAGGAVDGRKWTGGTTGPLINAERASSPKNLIEILPAEGDSRAAGRVLLSQLNGWGSNAPNAANFNDACKGLMDALEALGFNKNDRAVLHHRFVSESPLARNAVGYDLDQVIAQMSGTSGAEACPRVFERQAYRAVSLPAIEPPAVALPKLKAERDRMSRTAAQERQIEELRVAREERLNEIPRRIVLGQFQQDWLALPQVPLFNDNSSGFPVPEAVYSADALAKEFAKILVLSDRRMGYWSQSTADPNLFCGLARSKRTEDKVAPRQIPIAIRFSGHPSLGAAGLQIEAIEVAPSPIECDVTKTRWKTRAERDKIIEDVTRDART